MKLNKTLLTNQVRNKLVGKCTSAIVTEAFINGLPFDSFELAAEAQSLASFSNSLITKMHPENLLEKACEAATDPMAKLYLTNLSKSIEDIAEEATQRIMSTVSLEGTTAPEIMKEVKLDEKETEKLVNASKQNGTEAVAKVIKKKMIDVIKDEKEAYETSAKLRTEIKSVIKDEQEDLEVETDTQETPISDDDGPGGDVESMESYLSIILSPQDAREHVSFFSRLQDICMEGVFHSTEDYYGEIPYQTMEKIALESTLPYFDLSDRTLTDEMAAMTVVTEAAIEEGGHSPEELAMKKKKIAKTAFICSICIMTMLETLKTMHLAKPTVQDVKNFVDAPTNMNGITLPSLKRIENKVDATADTVKKSVAMGAFNTVELAKAKEALLRNKEMLEKYPVTEAYQAHKDRILNKLNNTIESIVEPVRESETPITSSYVARLKEENLATLEHAFILIGRKPMVETMQLMVRADMKTAEMAKVDVELRGLDSSGSPVASYIVSIHALDDFGENVAAVIRDCGNYIDPPKPVYLYFTDTGYSVSMKG